MSFSINRIGSTITANNNAMHRRWRTVQHTLYRITRANPVIASVCQTLMPDIRIDRDSVCAGDDVESHQSTLTPVQLTPKSIVSEILSRRYLPMAATWILRNGNSTGMPIAVLGLQSSPPFRFYFDGDGTTPLYELTSDPVVDLYLEYFLLVPPQLVVEALRDGKSLPDRFSRPTS